MTSSSRSALLACLLALAPTVLSAQAPPETPAQPLRLDDAVGRAVAASHRVAEAMARNDGAAAAVASRHAATKPQVVGVAGYTRTNHVDEFGILLPNNQLRVIYPDIPDNARAPRCAVAGLHLRTPAGD